MPTCGRCCTGRRHVGRPSSGCGWAGSWAWRQGGYGGAAGLCEESLALGRDLGDKAGIAESLLNLGRAARYQGDYARATALFEESLALARDLGDKAGIADSLLNL